MLAKKIKPNFVYWKYSHFQNTNQTETQHIAVLYFIITWVVKYGWNGNDHDDIIEDIRSVLCETKVKPAWYKTTLKAMPNLVAYKVKPNMKTLEFYKILQRNPKKISWPMENYFTLPRSLDGCILYHSLSGQGRLTLEDCPNWQECLNCQKCQ